MKVNNSYPILTAEDAVTNIKNNDTISFSGFGSAGSAKVLPISKSAIISSVPKYHPNYEEGIQL